MTTPDPPPGSPPVEVRRSKRRRRTVQAYMRDDTVVVLLPARMTKAEERFWVAEMVGRLERQEERRQRHRNRTDAELLAKAKDLSGRYLDGRAQPSEVRWVTNQNDRWGSCTPGQGTIRLSDRLRDFPTWVSDYVLLHELTHLLEPGHGQAFWRLVNRYPKTERARGYLEGVLAAATPTDPPTTLDDDVMELADEPDPNDGAGPELPGVSDGELDRSPWAGADAEPEGVAGELLGRPEGGRADHQPSASLGSVAAREEPGRSAAPAVGPADSLQRALPTAGDAEADPEPQVPVRNPAPSSPPPTLPGGAGDDTVQAVGGSDGEQDALW